MSNNHNHDSRRQRIQCEIVTLPEGYKLWCWKVRNGSSVRAGETVALAVPLDDRSSLEYAPVTATTTTTPATSSIVHHNHKRPTRRRRPVPAATTEVNDNAAATTAATAAMDVVNNDIVASGSISEGKSSSKPSFETNEDEPSFVAKNHATTTGSEIVVSAQKPLDSKSQQVAVVANASGIVWMGAAPTALSKSMTAAAAITGEIIGYIRECQHPTIIEGMCAVCGTKIGITMHQCENNSNYLDADLSTVSTTTTTFEPGGVTLDLSSSLSSHGGGGGGNRMTVSGLTVTVSEVEGQRMALEDTLRLQRLRKLSLVLDLDHTLVHATADPRAQTLHHTNPSVRSLILPVIMVHAATGAAPLDPQQPWRSAPQQQVWFQRHFVKLRPHLREFIESAKECYEIGVYTAGTREYAEQITILIARHLVGSKHDQVELESLRQQLARAEQAYQNEHNAYNLLNKHHPVHENVNNSEKESDMIEAKSIVAEKEIDSTEIINGAGPKIETMSEAKTGAVNSEGIKNEVRTKRKRVTFGEAPPVVKSDQISKEQVDRLRAELDKAERLERQALDLRQKLFGSRVVSRTEVGDLGRDVKSLKRIFPCGGSMAAVVDDREDVWANADDIKSTRCGEPPENLILVRPYHWNMFLGFADVNNASGTDFLEESAERSAAERESDEQLLWTADILKRLHHRYYSYDGPDQPTVPETLQKIRREVLSGCQLVLSGLVPLHKQQSGDPNLPRFPFVRYAESLGSTVLPMVTDFVTHVVAAKDGTDKIAAARRVKGCHVVKASWLIECFWSLSHRDESRHTLNTVHAAANGGKNSPSQTHPQEDINSNGVQPLTGSTRENSSSTSSDNDEDDDDFAADLEDELMRDADSGVS